MASFVATGYIHRLLDDNLTLEQFALYCANLPDEWHDPSTYHEEDLAKTQIEIRRLHAMTDAEREREGVRLRVERITSLEAREAVRQGELARLRVKLVEVEAWEPPTVEHNGLKELMRRQIAEALEREEGCDFYDNLLNEARAMSADDYFTNALAELRRDYVYHMEECRKDKERYQRRRQWAETLVSSFSKAT